MAGVNFNDTTVKASTSGGGGGSASLGDVKLNTLTSSTLPSGFLLANGAEVSRSTYSDLFTLIGENYGSGNGSTTFNLPAVNINYGIRYKTTSLPAIRTLSPSVTLPDGRVLIVGGNNGPSPLSNVDFISSRGTTLSITTGTALPVAINTPQMTLLPDGRVLITGGEISAAITANTYFGTISGNSVTWVAGTPLPTPLFDHSISVQPDGRILIICGKNASTETSLTYFGTISGTTITYAAGTAFPQSKRGHSQHNLPDGRILVLGGFAGVTYYNQGYFGVISGNTITWTLSPNVLANSVQRFSVISLPDSRIFLSGGSISSGTLSTTYLISVSNNNFTLKSLDSLPIALFGHSTAILSNGQMLIMGGYNNSFVAQSDIHKDDALSSLVKVTIA